MNPDRKIVTIEITLRELQTLALFAELVLWENDIEAIKAGKMRGDTELYEAMALSAALTAQDLCPNPGILSDLVDRILQPGEDPLPNRHYRMDADNG